MPVLNNEVLSEVQKILGSMTKPVVLKYFSQPFECGYCKDTHELLNDLVSVNDKLSIEVYQFDKDTNQVQSSGIELIPAISVELKVDDSTSTDYGIKFYGIPAGYEFSSLLNAILMVSTGVIKLTTETKAFLNNLSKPVQLKVFVSPTCPYCPPAVMLAHQFAFYSKMVKADMVEITEYPHLANKYSVQGVPRTVINEKWYLEGAAPEVMLVQKIKEAL